jgi:hypothetical protein
MTVISRCNYAGSFGKRIPTLSFAAFLVHRLRAGIGRFRH